MAGIPKAEHRGCTPGPEKDTDCSDRTHGPPTETHLPAAWALWCGPLGTQDYQWLQVLK